jgi:hypothetical protein
MDLSGYQRNTVGEVLSLRPALNAAEEGEVRFKRSKYVAPP